MDNTLSQFIKEEHQKGSSRESIYQKLLSEGKSIDEIEKTYLEVTQPEKHEDLQKKVITIFVVFGAILVGAGIFSFIASNWQEISKSAKVILLISSMIAFYIFGYYLKEEKKFEKTGEAVILLGSIAFGASIFLIAQIFNIRAEWPEGFVIWFLGAIGIAYTFNSKLLFGAFALIAAAGTLSQVVLLSKPITHGNLSLALLVALFAATFATGYFLLKKHQQEEQV